MIQKLADMVFQIVLVFLFFLVITPIGLIIRASGKDYLMRRLKPEETTYWNNRKKTNE
jgi:hypothetical protein